MRGPMEFCCNSRCTRSNCSSARNARKSARLQLGRKTRSPLSQDFRPRISFRREMFVMLRSTVSLLRCSEKLKRGPVRRPSLEVLEDRILLDLQFPNLLVNDPRDDGKSAQDTQSETTLVVG